MCLKTTKTFTTCTSKSGTGILCAILSVIAIHKFIASSYCTTGTGTGCGWSIGTICTKCVPAGTGVTVGMVFFTASIFTGVTTRASTAAF